MEWMVPHLRVFLIDVDLIDKAILCSCSSEACYLHKNVKDSKTGNF